MNNDFSVSASFSGGLYADGIYFFSDRRIKKNIELITDSIALEKLRKIEPYWYNYKDPILKSSHRVLGFIAQQVRLNI